MSSTQASGFAQYTLIALAAVALGGRSSGAAEAGSSLPCSAPAASTM